MQKLIRFRVIRRKQRSSFTPDHLLYSSIFLFKPLKKPVSRKFFTRIKVKKLKKRLLKRRKKKRSAIRRDITLTALRKTINENKSHLIGSSLSKFLAMEVDQPFSLRPILRKGHYTKRLFQNQSILYTSAIRRLLPFGRHTLFRFSLKKKLKRFERKQKKESKKEKNYKKFQNWLNGQLGTNRKRYISQRKWKLKMEKKSKKKYRRFFLQDWNKKETHRHLYNPQGWNSKSIKIRPIRFRHYFSDVTYNSYFWQKYKWLSQKKFNTSFFSGYTKAIRKQFKNEKWLSIRERSYDISRIERDYKFGIKAAKKNLLWPDQPEEFLTKKPINKPVPFWDKFVIYKEARKRLTLDFKNRYWGQKRRFKWSEQKFENKVKGEDNSYDRSVKEKHAKTLGVGWAIIRGIRGFEPWAMQSVEKLEKKFNVKFSFIDKIIIWNAQDVITPTSTEAWLTSYKKNYKQILKEYLYLRPFEKACFFTQFVNKFFRKNRNFHFYYQTQSNLRTILNKQTKFKKNLIKNYNYAIFKKFKKFKINNNLIYPFFEKNSPWLSKRGLEDYMQEALQINFSRQQRSILYYLNEKTKKYKKPRKHKNLKEFRRSSPKRYDIYDFRHVQKALQKLKNLKKNKRFKKTKKIKKLRYGHKEITFFKNQSKTKKTLNSWLSNKQQSMFFSAKPKTATQQNNKLQQTRITSTYWTPLQLLKERVEKNQLYRIFSKKNKNKVTNKFNFKFKRKTTKRIIESKKKRERLLSSYIHVETDCDFQQTWPKVQHKPHVYQVWLVKEKEPQFKKEIEATEEDKQKEIKKNNIKEEKPTTSKNEFSLIKKGTLRPTIHFPRYIKTLLNLKGRPLRRKTTTPGKGARAFARLYRSHFLTKLLEVVREKKGKIWRQLTPYGFNSPYSYRWRRLDRRSYIWARHKRRFLRWGPKYGARVLTRIHKGRPVRRRYLPKLFKEFRFRKAKARFWTLKSKEWRLRIKQLRRQVYKRKRKYRAIIWLNKQLTATYQDAKINMKTGEIKHAVRIRKFVVRRRRVRSFRRKKKLSRWLRKRILRWTFYYVHYCANQNKILPNSHNFKKN